ncbi:MAG TPA: acyltransferase domain-containing protein [Thermoanaerobaculia bacterium]
MRLAVTALAVRVGEWSSAEAWWCSVAAGTERPPGVRKTAWTGTAVAQRALVASDAAGNAERWLRELGIEGAELRPSTTTATELLTEASALAGLNETLVVGACDAKSLALLCVTRGSDTEAYAWLRSAANASGVELVQVDGRDARCGDAVRDTVSAPCLLRTFEDDAGGAVAAFAAIALAVFAVHDRVLPPAPDSPIDGPFCGTTRMQPWLSGGGAPLRALAGGAGGWTLVESADGAAHPPPSPLAGSELLVVSAGSAEALVARIEDLCARLRTEALHDVARQLACEPLRAHRASIVATTAAQASAALRALISKVGEGKPRVRTRAGALYADVGAARRGGKIAFLFPGQGSYYGFMHAELAPRFPQLRRWLEEIDRISIGFGDRLAHHLYPPSSGLPEARRREIEARLLEPEIGGQTGIACSLGLLELLRGGGVRPDVVSGYSNGENAALVAAGVVESGDRQLLSLLALMRGEGEKADAAGRIPKGVSCAVSGIALEELRSLAQVRSGNVHLAMDNCPNQRVLFGPADAMEEAAAEVMRRGGMAVRLPLNRGYHTPLFAAKAAHIRELYDTIAFHAPTVPIYSAMTAAPMPSDPDAIRDVAASQWRSTVRFRETIERLYEDGVRIFLEVGAGAKLTGFVADTLRGREFLALPMDVEGRSALASLQQFVAELAIAGRIDRCDALLPCRCARCSEPRRTSARTALPPVAAGAPEVLPRHFALMREFLAREANSAAAVFGALRRGGASSYERILSLDGQPWLGEHALGRNSTLCTGGRPLPVVPLTVSLDLLAEAATRVAGGVAVRIEGVRAHRWLALDAGERNGSSERTLALRIVAEPRSDGSVRVAVHDLSSAGAPMAVEGVVRVASAYAGGPPPMPPLRSRASIRHDARAFYELLFHGPALQSVRTVSGLEADRIDIEAEMPPPPAAFATPAMLLDASGQAAGYWLLESERALCNIFPFEIEAVSFHAPPPAAGHALAVRGVVDADPAFVSTSTDFVDGDRVAARVEGMRMRRYRAPARLAELLAGSRDALTDALQADDPGLEIAFVRDVPAAFLMSAEEIWSRTLAQLYLTRAERREWWQLAGAARRAAWLLGRIAAKEAIRRCGARELGVTLLPAQIEIRTDGEGRPVAAPVAGAVPALSIAHARDHVVAAAAFAFARVGVDVEVPRAPAVDFRAAFDDAELAKFDQEERLALWCAKEAAAKMLGTGLRGVPREWRIAAYDGRTAAIDFRGRTVRTVIRAEPDHCLAVCAASPS